MAAHAADILADLHENWTAEDDLPLDACLERVRKADALLGLLSEIKQLIEEHLVLEAAGLLAGIESLG